MREEYALYLEVKRMKELNRKELMKLIVLTILLIPICVAAGEPPSGPISPLSASKLKVLQKYKETKEEEEFFEDDWIDPAENTDSLSPRKIGLLKRQPSTTSAIPDGFELDNEEAPIKETNKLESKK